MIESPHDRIYYSNLQPPSFLLIWWKPSPSSEQRPNSSVGPLPQVFPPRQGFGSSTYPTLVHIFCLSISSRTFPFGIRTSSILCLLRGIYNSTPPPRFPRSSLCYESLRVVFTCCAVSTSWPPIHSPAPSDLASFAITPLTQPWIILATIFTFPNSMGTLEASRCLTRQQCLRPLTIHSSKLSLFMTSVSETRLSAFSPLLPVILSQCPTSKCCSSSEFGPRPCLPMYTLWLAWHYPAPWL